MIFEDAIYFLCKQFPKCEQTLTTNTDRIEFRLFVFIVSFAANNNAMKLSEREKGENNDTHKMCTEITLHAVPVSR